MTAKEHVVIVGGSSGIGLSTARLLLKQGYKVTIVGRSASRLALACDKLEGDYHSFVMDATESLTLPDQFAHLGSFSHLVLALGSSRGAGPFASVSLEEVRAGFEEKVYAHFATAQAALPHLTRGGSMTFIAAVTAHAAMPGTAGIGAANAAVAALVPVLAAELQPLRVNAVSPGVTDTAWWSFLSEAERESVFADYASKTPVGRVGQPDDIAQAVAFLIANTFISGQTVICDGGLSLRG